MFTQNHKKVAAVCGILQAAAVQSTLEDAGIPTLVTISKTSAFLDVLVPEPLADYAQLILHPELLHSDLSLS